MNEDIIAYLISHTVTKNAYKQEIITDSRTEIFAQLGSITRAEFYNAGKQGLNPDFVLTTARIDYNGEDEIEVNGVRYGIYRTYPIDQDYIELYCQKKGGVETPPPNTNTNTTNGGDNP